MLEVANHGGSALVATLLFLIAPDLTMVIGASAAGNGKLSLKAVPYYNLVHRPWIPLAVLVIYSLGGLGDWVPLFTAGLGWLASALTRADSLVALAATYRAYALAHPHLYRLMNSGPLPRHLLPPGVEEATVLPLVRAVGGDMNRARAVWAFAHGMVILELDGRFPPDADLDNAWRRGLTAFATRLSKCLHVAVDGDQ